MVEEKIDMTAGDFARLIGAKVVGDPATAVTGPAPVASASAGEITFIASPRYAEAFGSTAASVVIIDESTLSEMGGKEAGAPPVLLIVKEPYVAFAVVLGHFRPAYMPPPGIDPSAVVHETAELAEGVSVGPCSVVMEGSKLAAGVVLFPGVYIGPGVEVGEGSIIYSNVSVREGTRLGKRVIINCNSVVGSDGFGFAKKESGRYGKIPQTGTVTICDDVEIGACTTVDRATIGETVIGRGTKIDNLVQVAHNCVIGEDTILVANVAIAGSTKVGSNVTLAGQAGVTGHIEIADGVTVGPRSGVTKNITEKGVYTGYPAVPHGDWLRSTVLSTKLPEMKRKIEELEKRLRELESKG